MLVENPDLEALLTRLHDPMIAYPRFTQLQQAIAQCQLLSRIAREPQCMALEGPAGAGKTTLIRAHAAQFPRREEPEGTVIPVLYMEMPAPATIKGTASKLLECLGDPTAGRGTQWSLDSRLIKFIITCRVELVILDDFHHLIDTENGRVLTQVSEWLKVLIKETGVPFLVVGITGQVERILRANDQLSRLFAVRETLAPFAWTPVAGETLTAFHQFVRHVETGMGIPLTAQVPRAELLGRLHYATDGVVANLMNLLRSAALLAAEQQQECIELGMLAQAFATRLARHLPGQPNPFTAAEGSFVPPQRLAQGADPVRVTTPRRGRRKRTVERD